LLGHRSKSYARQRGRPACYAIFPYPPLTSYYVVIRVNGNEGFEVRRYMPPNTSLVSSFFFAVFSIFSFRPNHSLLKPAMRAILKGKHALFQSWALFFFFGGGGGNFLGWGDSTPKWMYSNAPPLIFFQPSRPSLPPMILSFADQLNRKPSPLFLSLSDLKIFQSLSLDKPFSPTPWRTPFFLWWTDGPRRDDVNPFDLPPLVFSRYLTAASFSAFFF